MNYHGVHFPDTNRGQALTPKQLLQVAKTLGQEWEEVAINLDLSITDLDVIKQGENNNVNMMKLKMLDLWKRRTIEDNREATAQDLLRGLKDMTDLPGETHNLLRGNVAYLTHSLRSCHVEHDGSFQVFAE